MAFTVATDNSSSGANSYVSVADADTYHTDRNNTDWTGATTTAKQAALIKATDFIDASYEWLTGTPVDITGALDWPRTDAYYPPGEYFDLEWFIEGIPDEIEQATNELALIALNQTLEPAVKSGIKRQKVGELEIEYTGGMSERQVYRLIDRILHPIGIRKGSTAKVYRG